MSKEEMDKVLDNCLRFLKAGTVSIESVTDVINGIINTRLSAQEEKHNEEMEAFNKWCTLNKFGYSEFFNVWNHKDYYSSVSEHHMKRYTFTELIEMFKKSLDIK